MKIKTPQSQTRLFGRASESVTRGDRRQRELEFESPSPPLTARPNRRRDGRLGWMVKASPLEGAPNECKTGDEILTPVGHPFISDSVRRFAPTTVRQDRNGVRHGLEQVSAFIGIRNNRATPMCGSEILRQLRAVPEHHLRLRYICEWLFDEDSWRTLPNELIRVANVCSPK